MKRFTLSTLLAVIAGGAVTACQNTKPATPSRSPEDRPYNLQKGQFEDPAPPKHRTSPGDAAR